MRGFAVLALACLLLSRTDAFFLNLPGLGLPGAGGCSCAAQPVCPPQPQCASPPPPVPCPVPQPCAPAPVVANYIQPQPVPLQAPVQQPLPQPLPQEAVPPPAHPHRNHEYSSGPGPANAQINYEAAKIEHKDAKEGEAYDDEVEIDPNGVDIHASSSFEAQHAPINPQKAKKIARREAKTSVDTECNSEAIRKIILENVKETPAKSKRVIQKLAREQIGGRIDVICAKGKFSYIVNSEVYCEAERNGITCFAFKQAE